MDSLEFRVFLDANAPCQANSDIAIGETLNAAELAIPAELAIRSAAEAFEIEVEIPSDSSNFNCDTSNSCLCVLVRVRSADVSAVDFGAARELYDNVLSDRSGLAEHYEQSVLSLESLTPHQKEKLQDCGIDANKTINHVHLHAPAGAGKTFVALHRALEVLQDQSNTSKHVLFIARNEALSYFAATWIGKRVKDPSMRMACLRRLHVLHEPFENVQAVAIKQNRVFLTHCESLTSADAYIWQYDLVIVDEAQHIYSNSIARELVEAYITDRTQRLLLSDVSQSLGHDIAYPDGLKDVVLSEVVRCSKRIVAGAMAFQLGGTEKLLTKCHHESTGPPLKSFLFDGPGDATKTNELFQAYAEQTCRALDHVVVAFPDLNLRNRVALVVPDISFMESLRPELSKLLHVNFPSRKFCLVDAKVACSDLGPSVCVEEPEPNESNERSDYDEESEWLVYDAMCHMDGLERLIVIGIGLDAVINSADVKPNLGHDSNETMPLETRSMLYRAVTRAHLMFLVVNEFLRGGWLEFLGSVRLRDDEAFNSATELKRTEVQAVEDLVKTELTEMITMSARSDGLKLDDKAMSILVAKAAAFQEGGHEKASAVGVALRSWKSAANMVATNVQSVATKIGLPLPAAARLDSICTALTIAVLKGDADITTAATEALKRAFQDDRNTEIMNALKAVLGDDNKTVLTMLASRVSTSVEHGNSIESAAKVAVEDWRQMEVQIASAVRAKLSNLQRSVANYVEVSLCSEAAARMCKGEDIVQAVDGAISKWRRSELDGQISSALESALEYSLANVAICEVGASVVLCNLSKKPELNGREGTLQSFNVKKQRWEVIGNSTRLAIMAKEDNLDVQIVAAQWSKLRCSKIDAIPLWKTDINETLEKSMEQADNIETLAAETVKRWRRLEAYADYVLDSTALSRQRHLAIDVRPALIFKVVQTLWCQDTESTDYAEMFENAVASALDEWEMGVHIQQEEESRISSELESKANLKRILLTDAARATLLRRVTSSLRRGMELGDAVDAALNEWEKQLVRQKVQQMVWDPSGNLTRKVTGVVRFMPYKQNFRDSFDYWLLPHVFAFLPFNHLGHIGSVCKRWRNAAYDPSWKPELVAYAWGDAEVNGLSMRCTKPTLLDFSLAKQVVQISCADNATFALTEMGAVWFWGRSWHPDEDDCREPTRIHELEDIVSISVSPPGYHHNRRYREGYGCLAVTRPGALYAWGCNQAIVTLTQDNINRPCRITTEFDAWKPRVDRVLRSACGLDYISLSIERFVVDEEGTQRIPTVISCGVFCEGSLHNGQPFEWEELRGISLRQLEAGCFHCCALTTQGELYTFGDQLGMDHANGNLLGHGVLQNDGIRVKPPRRVIADGLGPISEVRCSSYTTIAITIDGRVFSWGDCDGDSLGHDERQCHQPTWLKSLRWQTVTHGALSYTNGAVATDDGHVFIWGGNMWQGGFAAGRNAAGPSEVKWVGVPSCYQCAAVEVAHKHGYLIFRKRP